ncbi:50S ribosomal protein L15 [Desulforhopalus singaporensis]|uniref:Large ribosomal subunit protein uL15 n=1 Tax=Desulforhopalus singaporensis TaxID=91360 RepID=A0A1H0RC59_9BACT|nr:50S ribosomal protein L15 [Desulforhopalus singaporensis]SDP26995.1 LSU ribosomal protein L15P [Desulforhopalus singaporensis]
MLTLANLSPKAGSTKQPKRLGRGPGSGHGKTAGRGHKGYKSRSGSGVKPGFEGGQMPLQRRLPKRGFNNVFKKEYALISLEQLDRFEADATVTVDTLIEAGLVKKNSLVKVLANGEITKAIKIKVDKLSKSAQAKIEAAGGTVLTEE